MKYGKRLRFNRLASSPIVLIIIIIVFLVLAKACWNIYSKSSLTTTRLLQAQAELADLEKRRRDLSERVDFLSTPAGLEAEMRTRYRAVREGESVAVIVAENQPTITTSSSATSSSSGSSWHDRFWNFLGF